MAALVPKTFLKLSRQHVPRAAGALIVSRRNQSNLALYKRGTGGRSSFSGVVATVFGATGYIGKGVINRLGKIGCQVIVPYRLDPYFYRDLKLSGDLGQVLFMPYFLKDKESIYKAMQYSNVVINCVEREFNTRYFTMDDINHKGARRIARIAKECGIQKFVHLSNVLAEPNPHPHYIKGGSEFVKTKWLGEQAVREEFPEAVVMRRSELVEHLIRHYGRHASRVRGKYCIWNKGESVLKVPVYTSNVAEGIVKVVLDPDSDGRTYDCVGPDYFYLYDIVDYFIKCMQRHYQTRITHPHPMYRLQVKITDRFWPLMMMKRPAVSLEKMERETLSEILSGRNPTLEDLGVKLKPLEQSAAHLLKEYQIYAYHVGEVGEWPDPPPPVTAPERDAIRRTVSAFL